MKLVLWVATEEATFKAEAEVITAEEADVAAEEYFMVDVDKEADMAKEESKNGDIDGPDLMPEWYSVTLVRR